MRSSILSGFLLILLGSLAAADASAKRAGIRPLDECPWARGSSHSLSMEGEVITVDDIQFKDLRYTFLIDGSFDSKKGDKTWRREFVAVLKACDAEAAIPHYKKWADARLNIPVGITFSWVILPLGLTVHGAIAAPRNKRLMLEAIEDSFPVVIEKERVRLEQARLAAERAAWERSRRSSRVSSSGWSLDRVLAAGAVVIGGGWLLFSDHDVARAIRKCGSSAAATGLLSALLQSPEFSNVEELAGWLFSTLEAGRGEALASAIESGIAEILGDMGMEGSLADATSNFAVCMADELS